MKQRERRSVAVLLSGGIDSSACVDFYASQALEVHPLFVDYGQPASRAELQSAIAICRFYEISLQKVALSGPKIPPFGEIFGRNLMLLSVALLNTGLSPSLIALGIHAGTRYFDCTPTFFRLCNQIMEGYSDGRTRIAAPFLRMDKAKVWAYCAQNKVPVHLTWSCEASSAKPCRKCLSCKDKESLLACA